MAPDAEFTLAPGGTAHVGDGRLKVTFDKVGEDSRCPQDVDCVWEGDAVVEVSTAVSDAQPTRHELHTNRQFATTAKAGDHRIRLVELTPSRRSNESIAPDAYRARLRVTAE